jgi:hypothetical protein
MGEADLPCFAVAALAAEHVGGGRRGLNAPNSSCGTALARPDRIRWSRAYAVTNTHFPVIAAADAVEGFV